MTIRTTSAAAYRRMQDNGRLFLATEEILSALANSKEPMTRRELEDATGLRTNQIAGRVNELIKQGRVVEDGRRRCKVTGNEVNVLRLADERDVLGVPA